MLVRDDAGQPVRINGIIWDITERKGAEKALQESDERLKRAQEIAHLGSWELDLVENRLTWSDEVYRLFGLQPQEFGATYEAFLERVHPEDRTAVDAAYAGSLRENRDTYEIEHRVIRKDTGQIRIVHEKCEHFRNSAGNIIRSVGMVHDITERKRAEQELQTALDVSMRWSRVCTAVSCSWERAGSRWQIRPSAIISDCRSHRENWSGSLRMN